MKKWKGFLLAVCLFFMPLIVFAQDTTDQFYMDISILENGDIKIKELAKLSGSYNGRKRNIVYINPTAPIFTGKESDFDGSSIYNGRGLTIDKVADVRIDSQFSFDSMQNLNHIFSRVNGTPQVAYQVYEQQDTSYGTNLKIYNSDRMKTAFYLEYTIQDAVVVHEDVAELAWNLLGDSYEENIDTFEARIHLPNEDQDYRVWLRGPLNGEVERKDNQTAVVTYDFLGAYNPISIRMMFDKDLVPTATKHSYVAGKSSILAVEKRAAEKANQERETIQRENRIVFFATAFWLICLIAAVIYFKIVSKSNRKSKFQQEYLREIPATYGPEVLEYLFKKKITDTSFSAVILSLVEKKVLTVSENEKKKKDYIFTLQKKHKKLTEQEEKVLLLLIKTIGNGESVSLDAIKKYGKSYKTATKMMDAYQSFVEISKENAKEEGFFEVAPIIKIMTICIASLGMVVGFFAILIDQILLAIFVFILAIFTIIYVASVHFYTEKGREDLAKWKALKKFLEDFSTFDEKTLPEVPLWNQYLIYASVLGCAETLQKQMKVKLDQMRENNTYSYDPIFWNHIYLYNSMSHVVSQSVHTAVASSRSSIAASRSSSSSGYGGGASIGGGSFGGGGGGGRF